MPATHVWHPGPASNPNVPAGQGSQAVLPAFDWDLAGQGVHAAAPLPEKLWFEQAVHGPDVMSLTALA